MPKATRPTAIAELLRCNIKVIRQASDGGGRREGGGKNDESVSLVRTIQLWECIQKQREERQFNSLLRRLNEHRDKASWIEHSDNRYETSTEVSRPETSIEVNRPGFSTEMTRLKCRPAFAGVGPRNSKNRITTRSPGNGGGGVGRYNGRFGQSSDADPGVTPVQRQGYPSQMLSLDRQT